MLKKGQLKKYSDSLSVETTCAKQHKSSKNSIRLNPDRSIVSRFVSGSLVSWLEKCAFEMQHLHTVRLLYGHKVKVKVKVNLFSFVNKRSKSG